LFWQDPPIFSYSNDSGSTFSKPINMVNTSINVPLPPILYSNGEQLFTAKGKGRVAFDSSTYPYIETAASGQNVYLVSKKEDGSDTITVYNTEVKKDVANSIQKYDIMLSYT